MKIGALHTIYTIFYTVAAANRSHHTSNYCIMCTKIYTILTDETNLTRATCVRKQNLMATDQKLHHKFCCYKYYYRPVIYFQIHLNSRFNWYCFITHVAWTKFIHGPENHFFFMLVLVHSWSVRHSVFNISFHQDLFCTYIYLLFTENLIYNNGGKLETTIMTLKPSVNNT